MVRFDSRRIRYPEDYLDKVDRLNDQERFVVVFASALACNDDTHQVRVYMDDLFTAKAVFADGASMSLFFLMDMVSAEPTVMASGIDIVDFGAWCASVFGRQFAGLLEADCLGELPAGKMSRLINTLDTPDLWLYENDKFSSLLIFDPYEAVYRVVETWISGVNNFVPKDIDEAIDSLSNGLTRLIDSYRCADFDRRARMIGRVLRKLEE